MVKKMQNLKLYDIDNNYVTEYQANVIKDYGNLSKFGDSFTFNMLPTLILEIKDMDMDYIDLYIVSHNYLEFDKEVQTIIKDYPNIYYNNNLVTMHNDIITIDCIKLVIYMALGLIVFITVVSIIGAIS